jgi:hypothetical protein
MDGWPLSYAALTMPGPPAAASSTGSSMLKLSVPGHLGTS